MVMMVPKISLIVPVYNVERYLKRCLDSLCGQTEYDVEIICIDDGSTDGSPAILADYAARDARVRATRHERNRGLSAARNTGLSLAQAPYLMFCDADDCYAPDMCERMRAAIESAEGVDFAACEAQLHSDAPISAADKKYYRLRHRGLLETDDKVLLSTDVSVWNKIFRRKQVEMHGIRFPENLLFEDNTFFHSYALCSKRAVYLQGQKLYHYHRRQGSIMSAALSGRCAQATDLLRNGEMVYAFMQQHGLLPERLHYFGLFFFGLISTATGFSRQVQDARAILDAAAGFLEHHRLDFSAFPDLVFRQELLRRRIPIGSVRSIWGGVLKIKYKASRAKLYLFGIPLGAWRSLPV